MTSVVLADDQALVRSGLRALLEARGVDVVGEAEHGRAAVEVARASRPDVLVMDIRMPVMDGVEATRRLVAGGGESGPRVLVLTVADDGVGFDPEDVDVAVHYGLRGLESLVRDHGGDLTVSSAPGRGTTTRLETRA